MSLPFPMAALSSLPLSVRLLAPHGNSAAMVAVAVWRWRWQISGSVVGREAAAQRQRQLPFSLAAAVEAQWRRQQWRQCGSGGISAAAAAWASSMATVSAVQCWWRQCSGGVGRAVKAAWQRRGDSGQRGGGVGSARAAAAARRRQWRRRQQLNGSGQQGGRAAAVAEAAAHQLQLRHRWQQQWRGHRQQSTIN
jgi:hypothetical protein